MKRLLSAVPAAILVIWMLPLSTFAAVNPQDSEFQRFLLDIGMNEEEFITYFEGYHGYTLEDFDSVQEMINYLGDTINEQNLKALLDEYGLTQEELEQLFAENGLSLDDFIFIDDLDVEVYYLTSDDTVSMDEEIALALLSEFGVTEEEGQRLADHLMKVMENADSEAFLTKLLDLEARLSAFPEFDSSSDLTPAQMVELLDIWEELLELFEVKVDYYLVKNGVETPVSISALLQMDTVDEADLLIKIYSKDGQFLADLLITKEMFGSDFIHHAGQKAEKAVKSAAANPEAENGAKPVVKTVNGGKLPDTAAGYLPQAAAGFALIILGAFLFRKHKVKGA
ncbi:processed acidic surface protein [Siminovitchia sediminis]|uniref:Processed acidic surface protein n=1 Tax=Siminovitchia sediminis TaxID=1274353 RepID=A0ABW4KE29_9BACI